MASFCIKLQSSSYKVGLDISNVDTYGYFDTIYEYKTLSDVSFRLFIPVGVSK
jgi:hypothetical protein